MIEVPLTGAPRAVVRELGRGDEARWDEFVRAAADGTFYHLSAWRGIIENQLNHRCWYLQCERDGVLSGVLPIVQVKSRLFGNALISIPFLVYGGPLSTDPESTDALTDAAVDLAHNLKVDYVEFRNRATPVSSVNRNDWQTKSGYVTFRKALSESVAENLAAIPRKQRAMIRKGVKAGLRAEIDFDSDRLYAALLECKRNLGTPFFGPRYLRAIVDAFGDQAEITTVMHDQKLVCSVMSFQFRNEVLPYYGGGGQLARALYGNDFMYWAVMERACNSGIEIFDYGRSMAGTGAYRFKKHWGFDEQPLDYRYRMVEGESVPDLNPSNPKYQFLIKCWKRLPLPLAGIVGPRLAKYLG